ncbi:MAG: hypothetical protein AAB470_03370 [Patescibacteria group bacterium]
MQFQTGILDRTRLVSNLLMLVLLIGNIYFSVQYMENTNFLANQKIQEEADSATRFQTSRFLKFFIDTVVNTKGTISYEDRVKLENDLRQIHDSVLTAQWDTFVASKDSSTAQASAAKLMSILASKLI